MSKNSEKDERVVLTTLQKLTCIVNRNLNLLHINQEIRKVFTPGVTVPFRSTSKEANYLVRVKLYLLERTVVS